MKLEDLPSDILYRITTYGGLDIRSIINLSLTNKQLFGNITNDDQLWRYVYYHNWGSTSEDYQISHVLSSDKTYFDNVMHFYKLSKELEADLKRYEPWGNINVGYYLNKYTHEDVYIPIIVQHLNKKHQNLLSSLRKFHDTELTQLSLLSNINNCQNFRIGLNYLNDPDDSDLEYAWFMTSVMNNGSHKLIHNRLNKLQLIRTKLYDIIYRDDLQSHNLTKVNLSASNDLSFNDESAYYNFIQKAINEIYSCLSIEKLRKEMVKLDISYYHDTFIEDFDILRVYSDLSKGHPYVIVSIIQKALYEFMNKFNSISVAGQPITFTADITKVFLKVNNFYVFPELNHSGSGHPYRLRNFTGSEVFDYLRSLNMNHMTVENFLKPFQQSEYKEMVINLEQLSSIHSARECVIYERRPTEFLNPDELEFKEFIGKFLFYKSNGGYSDFSICSDFERYLMDSNNLIHFNTLYQILKKNNNQSIRMLTQYFKLPVDIEYNEFYGKHFNLLDEKSPISFQRVIESKIRYTQRGWSTPFTDKTARGQLVKHSRFDTIGVVLGPVRESDVTNGANKYYYVHTMNKSIEVYDISALIPINDPVGDKDLVINFIERAGIEIIGLFYFSEIQYLDGTPFFIDIKV
ncbi:hypothetical protein DFJ63DRAFT_311634 [Scheffersomyces coipomensis]|uniref:uncharacterized protein n=1 Tax=Scheffersomyces coipomensis TaxID=1788519 RepID=UPI00315CA77C